MAATKPTSMYEQSAIQGAKSNGVVESVNAAPTGPMIIRRLKWLDLPDEYEGFKIRVWLNPPAKMWQQVFSDDASEEEKQQSLSKIVLEHNGWRDYDGAVYPDANTKEFWEAIPNELAALVIAVCQRQSADLPTSVLARKRN